MNRPYDYRMSGDYQRAVDQWVRQHIHGCASHLVQDLADVPKFEADLCDLFSTQEWEEPVREHCREWTEDEAALLDFMDTYSLDQIECWQDAADFLNVDPHEQEVLEHWLVSSDLAYWLSQHDEVVGEISGLNIWGRMTSGQSISIDGVICDIYDRFSRHTVEVAA